MQHSFSLREYDIMFGNPHLLSVLYEHAISL